MKTPRLIAAALAILLVFSACGTREIAVEAGIRTKTLLVGNGGEPATLDPAIYQLVVEGRVIQAIFESLTGTDARTSQPVPTAAERWETSTDGLTWTFHLRPNARWSNGDPVTAHEFVFSYRRSLSPKIASPQAYILFVLKNAEAYYLGKLADFTQVGAVAVDDHTLRLTLAHPVPYLPSLVTHTSFGPMHRASIEQHGSIDDRSSPWTRPGRLVGNGPFTLVEWRAHDRIVARRNPHYWDAARIRLEQIVFSPTENADTEEASFRGGQLHVTHQLAPAKLPRYREREPGKLRCDPSLGARYLNFNAEFPMLRDARIRRALSLAIDREALVRTVYFGSQRPAAHFTPPDCGGYTTRERVPTDFAAARRLLADAGFPDGQGLTGLEFMLGLNPDLQRLAEVLQEMWRRELGVRVAIAPTEHKTMVASEFAGNFSITIAQWFADYVDPLGFLEILRTGHPQNTNRWTNPEYDRLVVEGARTLDPARRFELFQQAEAILLKQAPVAPLYFISQNYLAHPAVKGWRLSAINSVRYQDVWLEE